MCEQLLLKHIKIIFRIQYTYSTNYMNGVHLEFEK